MALPESEDDWFVWSGIRFLRRIEQVRDSMRAGRGVRLEDVD